MNDWSRVFSLMLPVLYLTVISLYGFIFFGRNKKLEPKTGFILALLLVFHAFELLVRAIALQAIPVSTLSAALSFWAFALTCVYFLIELSMRNRSTGLFVLTLAFLLLLIAAALNDWNTVQNPMLRNPLYAIHAGLTIMGYTAICISSLYALLYIVLNHMIKKHTFGLWYEKLPSLSILENLSIRSVQIGIILLGLGILLGHLRAGALLDAYVPVDPKVILTDLVWLLYLVGYGVAQHQRWRGRWMAYLSLGGFLILLLLNMTVILLLDSFHRF